MSRFKIVESVEHHRLHNIHQYDDLGIHHPTANATGIRTGREQDFEPRRSHELVDGKFEEVRHLSDGRVLVKKDFVLSHDGQGDIRIPSPIDGYVHYRHDNTATIRVYDKPFGEPGAKLLAQVLHMNPRTFHLKEGEYVAYGQPLGVMGDTGTPHVIHAHVEAEPEQFRRYIRDIDSGVIAPDRYPAFAQAQPMLQDSRPPHSVGQPHVRPNTHQDHGIGPEHSALRQGDNGPHVTELQQTLSHLNYRTPTHHPLSIDGHFGADTRHAVEAFQREHGLHVDGVVGKDTRSVLAATQANPFTSKYHPHHALYEQALHQVHVEESHRHIQSGPHSEALAGALTVAAANQGLSRIDRVQLNDAGTLVRAIQVSPVRDEPGLNHATMPIGTQQAMHTPLLHSSEQLQQAPRHHDVPSHVQASPSMAM